MPVVAAGIAAKGERADTYPFVLDLRGPDQFRKLARMLAGHGDSAAAREHARELLESSARERG